MDRQASFLAETVPLWIDGAPAQAADGGVADVVGPSTGAPVATAALAGPNDVENAVRAAVAAGEKWSRLPAAERADHLVRFADLLERDLEVIAALETLDVGKPLRDSRGFDIPFAIDAYRYFAELARHQAGDRLDVPGAEARQHGVPRGVCALIFPWNAPFLLSSWSLAPALAAGNTVVLKPSELTPLSSVYAAQVATEAGIPDGVLNVIPGAGRGCGEALVSHPDIAMISFTGSPETGRQIAATAAANFVPTKLELGGKGAAIVFEDVDVEATAAVLVEAITMNAGQVCCTATRWIMHADVFDDVVDAASARLRGIRVGPGEQAASDMGPLITEEARQRVLRFQREGEAAGAQTLLRGGDVTVSGAEGGFYVAPAIMTGAPDNVCAQREIFGPVAYAIPFTSAADAVELANGTRYGLANSVWSGDVARAEHVAEQLRSGLTWVNTHNWFAYGLPYGGIKSSGWGGGVNSGDTYRDYQHRVTLARPVG
jgi:aldehyde dehydrogenase (NAD+)